MNMLNSLCRCGCGKETPIATRNRYELKDYIKGQPIPFLVGHQVRSRMIKGSKHWNYKGDKAGYKAFHLRVNNIRGKAIICENCRSDYFVEWANLTGKYQDPMDYRALCRRCHNQFDNPNKKGWETRRKKTSYEASSSESSAEGGVAEAP